MANKKISQLNDGTSFQAGDEAVVNRSGTNFKVDPTQFGSSIDVTGTVTADGLTVDGAYPEFILNDTRNLNTWADGAVLGQITFTTDDNNMTNPTAAIKAVHNRAGAGHSANDAGLEFYTSATTTGTIAKRLSIETVTGDISFYEDTGTTPAFYWDASAESLGIGTSSPAYPLDVRTTVSTIAGFYGDNAFLLVQNKSTGVLNLNSGGSGDSLAFETAGSEAMRINSSGNVGIGTTSPEATLNVVSSSASATTYPIRITNAANPSADVGVALEFGLVTSNDSRGSIGCHWTSASNSDGTYLSFAPNDGSTGNVERMRIDSDGNVGIGTSSPATALDVNGTVTADGADLDGAVVINQSGADVDFRVESDTRTHALFVQGSDGNVGIGATTPDAPLEVAASATTSTTIAHFSNSNSSQKGIIRLDDVGGGQFLLLDPSNNTDVLLSASDDSYFTGGNVGIGTSSPSQALDVAGNIGVSGGVYLGGTAAANLLDDYEEGTWTPEYEPETGAFSSISYQNQGGFYTKIGNKVFFQGRLRTSSISVGTASGKVYVSGLPFTPNSAGDAGRNAGAISVVSGWAGESPYSFDVETIGTYFRLYYRTSADGNFNYSDVSDLGTGSTSNQIFFSGSYTV